MTVRSSLLTLAAFAVTSSIALAEPYAKREPAERLAREAAKEDANEKPLPASIDLSGEWRMFLPAGWERTVRIDRLGDDRYYVRPPYVMQGTYEMRGRKLIYVSENRLDGDSDPHPEEAANPKSGDREPFVWTVRSPYLMTLTGGVDDYRDAVLFRSNGREIQDPNVPQAAATSPADGSSDAKPAHVSPLAVDLPLTKLDVKLFPGERGAQTLDGDLVFPVTIRNDSKQPIELKLPSDREAESSLAAHIRPIDPAHVEKRIPPSLAKPVYRDDGDESMTPDVTILPGESLKIDARLSLLVEGGTRKRLEPRRKYEIRLSMTFVAEGKLQYAVGPHDRVVTFDPVPRVR